MNFNSIIGQKEIISNLIDSIKNEKVGHAYIFTGHKGIGKRTVAKIFAGVLQCEESDGARMCGLCQPCRLFLNGENPDIKLVETENSSISIEEIRRIQSDINIRPMYSKRKVYIIIEAEKMTVQAQNCLLKTLEEPPSYITIILTASNYDALVGTIRSRAVRYSFKKNTYSEVKEFLKSNAQSNLQNIDFITSYSDGIIGTALELANSEVFSQIRDRIINILIKLNKSKLLDVFDIYGFFEENKAGIEAILDLMVMFYRDIAAYRETGKENILINYDKKDIILVNVSDFSIGKLVKNIEIIENTRRNIKQNANYQLSIEVMLMKLQED